MSPERSRARPRVPRLLTIAGSDSGGGAGIQADLKTFAALGAYGMSAVTAITAQNTQKVGAVQLVRPALVARQIEMVVSDLGVDAAKVGMLGTPPLVRVVARAVERLRVAPLVVDPVMVAKSGARLLTSAGEHALTRHLLPLATLVTPNWPEAAILSGLPVGGLRQAETAARVIGERIGTAVLVKGGHGIREPIDLLWLDGELHRFEGRRIGGGAGHGTGCTLSAAIATLLGWGVSLRRAIALGKRYVEGALAGAPRLGRGTGPLHHGWLSGSRRYHPPIRGR